jgi:hypothetical protein
MADVGFELAKKRADDFIDLLYNIGIDVKPGSQTETDALAITDIVEMWRDPNKMPANVNTRQLFRSAAGFIDFGSKILAVQDHPDFHELLAHLKTLCDGSFVQNRWSSVLDAVANKMIELYFGALSMQFATDVKLDDPVKSSGGTNPDVMFTYRGKRWALAMKTLHSVENVQTIFDNIRKGCEQIERSVADHGMVVINLKNVLNHDALWPENGRHLSEQDARDVVDYQIRSIAIDPEKFQTEEWKELFGAPRKAVLPVLYTAHCVAYAQPAHMDRPFPMPLKLLRCIPPVSSDPAGALKLANELNHYAQSFI